MHPFWGEFELESKFARKTGYSTFPGAPMGFIRDQQRWLLSPKIEEKFGEYCK